MKIYDVAIIGCGNVAGLYGSNTNTNLQTHASAYNQCEKTRIIAAVDPNIEQLDNFSKKWSIEHTFKDIDEMFQNVSPDIIIMKILSMFPRIRYRVYLWKSRYQIT